MSESGSRARADQDDPGRPPGSSERSQAIEHLLLIIDRLRDPGGCPWDREQTLESMAPCVVEEAHELVEAIETQGDSEVREEAGDVLMALGLICRIAAEQGRFDIGSAARGAADKLIRRHPHVFGDVELDSAGEVLANWEAIKRSERSERQADESALAGVPKALPALQRAQRICAKAVTRGFRWSSAAGAHAKLREEVSELDEALDGVDLEAPEPAIEGERRARVEHELGDVLLAAAYLGEYLDIDPERACREAVRRFEARFRYMESSLGGDLSGVSLAGLLDAWRDAKEQLNEA